MSRLSQLIAGKIAGADTSAVRRAAVPARTHALKEQQPPRHGLQ